MAADKTEGRSEVVGPTGRRVADNLRQLRAQHAITTAQLSSMLRELGQPILATGITKTEAGTRRVDVDDLMALAIALDVSPNRLLLTGEGGAVHQDRGGGRVAMIADETEIALTPAVRVPVLEAWEWATGEQPLLWPRVEQPVTRAVEERANAFRRENRPHAPVEVHYVDKRELQKHPELLRRAVALVRDATREGVPARLLHDFIELAVMTALNGESTETSTSEGSR